MKKSKFLALTCLTVAFADISLNASEVPRRRHTSGPERPNKYVSKDAKDAKEQLMQDYEAMSEHVPMNTAYYDELMQKDRRGKGPNGSKGYYEETVVPGYSEEIPLWALDPNLTLQEENVIAEVEQREGKQMQYLMPQERNDITEVEKKIMRRRREPGAGYLGRWINPRYREREYYPEKFNKAIEKTSSVEDLPHERPAVAM